MGPTWVWCPNEIVGKTVSMTTRVWQQCGTTRLVPASFIRQETWAPDARTSAATDTNTIVQIHTRKTVRQYNLADCTSCIYTWPENNVTIRNDSRVSYFFHIKQKTPRPLVQYSEKLNNEAKYYFYFLTPTRLFIMIVVSENKNTSLHIEFLLKLVLVQFQ